ncbi:26s proteasome regulatory subunit rpn-8 [Moniliophthora roreri]|nr:26s proteasome regulatory subunit rpn-8 [Moniliophthora roreri]
MNSDPHNNNPRFSAGISYSLPASTRVSRPPYASLNLNRWNCSTPLHPPSASAVADGDTVTS